MEKTLVIGLGNPILGDDGVGWKIADEVKNRLATSPDESASVEVDCASLGGLSLMERMLGYQHVVLIDSMETGQYPVGTVSVFPLAALPNPIASHSASAHDTSLMTALKVAQNLKAGTPERINVVAIEARDVYEFSENLSPAVESAIPEAVKKVFELLS